MTAQQVIDLAKNGELKNSSVKEDVNAVLGFINLGVLELYKRFVLDTKELILTMGRDGTSENPYIKINNTIYQMPSDFLYLVAAYEEVPKNSVVNIAPIQINNENNIMGVNMVSWNKLQIPFFVQDANISLIYSPSPKFFSSDDLGLQLPIPDQLVESLLAYIGYRAFASISPNPQVDVSNQYYAKFEASCEVVKQFGIYTAEDMDMKNKFTARGFA